MKIFLDTADTPTVKRLFSTGLIDGVTTNPSLIRKSGANPLDVYAELQSLGVPDISMEVYGTADEMYDEAQNLSAQFGDVATIKLPITVDGLSVTRKLSQQNIRTNVTLSQETFRLIAVGLDAHSIG